jgi:hypothetical protein
VQCKKSVTDLSVYCHLLLTAFHLYIYRKFLMINTVYMTLNTGIIEINGLERAHKECILS